jgi:Ohr subfamily peroxiredoxin
MNKILERQSTAYGGRDGVIKDTQSGLEITLSKPIEMGGEDENGSNPEELFSVGYSACFASSLEYLLHVAHINYQGLSVQATTKLMADAQSGFSFELLVHAKIEGVTKDVEKKFVEQAYQFCPYSKAIRGNVKVTFVD